MMHCAIRRGPALSSRLARNVYTWKRAPPLTKIVATIGPVSEQFDVLQKVVECGMRVMRINFSHATYEEADLRITNLKKCAGRNAQLGHPFNMRAVLLDTQGPEIRTGNLVGDTPIMLEKGNTIELHTDASYQDKGTAEAVYVNFTGLTETVHVGSNVLFDDGLISLGVLDVAPGKVTCMIENSGPLKNRRGVNLPGARVQLPPLSEKDKKDICYGIANDIDFVAASFVRKASDVVTIRKFINTQYKKTWPKGEHPPHIISKIENLEAVDNFPDILQESDAIMVARGDLGVELPMEQVTNLQKWMVQECNRVGKPVIVATQMLESMQQNPRPTRAEVSDVTNAVYDGADAVMLSGESAQGDYPVESVYTMRRIVAESEQWKQNHGVAQDGTGSASSKGLERYKDSVRAKAVEVVSCGSHADGIAGAAVHASKTLGAAMILCITKNGALPRLIAKYRPGVPVICFCSDSKIGRQLMLNRGLHPIIGSDATNDLDQPFAALADAQRLGFCDIGDTVVIAQREENDSIGETQTIRVCTIDSTLEE